MHSNRLLVATSILVGMLAACAVEESSDPTAADAEAWRRKHDAGAGPTQDAGTTPVDAGTSTDGATPGTGTTSDGGTFTAGNPNGSCAAGIPAKGKPVDTSNPTTVVGTG